MPGIPDRKRPPVPPAPVYVYGEWVLIARDCQHNYYERTVTKDGEPQANQTRKDIGDAINYADNDTGVWTPHTFVHTTGPAINPSSKPDFPAGQSLCEEQCHARKYVRVQTNKLPLMCEEWRGVDGQASNAPWLNLRVVGADTAVVPSVGDHWVTWTNAWTDCDYEVHFYGPGGWEFRMTLKSASAPTAFQWTIKKAGFCTMEMVDAHPVLSKSGVKVMYMAHPRVLIDGVENDDFPEPVWTIVPASPFDVLTLTANASAVSAAFAGGATTVEVRT